MQIAFFFAFFGGGFVRASNFSKIVKNLGKMQKKMQKNAKKMQKKCEKNAKKYKKIKQMQIAFFFAFFGVGFVRASNFSKLAKNLGKMQKKCEKNAKKMQILEMCMFYKNKFPEVAFLLAFFLHFPGPRFLGLHFLGAFFLHFFAF